MSYRSSGDTVCLGIRAVACITIVILEITLLQNFTFKPWFCFWVIPLNAWFLIALRGMPPMPPMPRRDAARVIPEGDPEKSQHISLK
jgi:hypothetical protein